MLANKQNEKYNQLEQTFHVILENESNYK